MLPQGASVVYEQGSLGGKATVETAGPEYSSATFGARVANWNPPRRVTAVGRGEVEQRLPGICTAGRVVVRVAVAELEVEALRHGNEQLAVDLFDLGFALGVVRHENTLWLLDDRDVVVDLRRLEQEAVPATAGAHREAQLSGPHVDDLALQVELGDVLLDFRQRTSFFAWMASIQLAAGHSPPNVGNPVVQVC